MTKWTMTGALAGRIIDDWFPLCTEMRFVRPQEWLDVMSNHDVAMGSYPVYRIEEVYRHCPDKPALEKKLEFIQKKMLESFMHDYFSIRDDVKNFRNAAHVLLGEGEDSPTWSWWTAQETEDEG